MNKARIDDALKLAQQLNDVAKSVPIQVDTLLTLIEPNSVRLRSVGTGPRTKPREVASHLRSIHSQFKRSKKLQQAVSVLIPDEAERKEVATCRDAMLEFYEKISKIPLAQREGKRRAALSAEFTAITDKWPRSRFVMHFLNDDIDASFQRLLGGDGWLVRIPSEGVHATVRRRLQRALQNPDAVSPMDAWQLCPVVCQRCWYALKDRMRRAKSVPDPGASVIDPDDLVQKKQAAARLGIRPEELSRYIMGARVAKWAMADRERFRRLLAVKGGALLKSNIDELLAWRDTEKRGKR